MEDRARMLSFAIYDNSDSLTISREWALKNAYLLGLDSAGDVIETMALLLVIAFGLAAIRPDDPLARAAAATRRAA